MTRLIFSLSVALLVPFITMQAQDIIDTFAEETCDCLSKKDLTGKTQDQLNMELGFCIMESMGKHSDKVDIDIADQSAMQAFGEKIGMRMATKCPAILQKVATMQTTEVAPAEQVMSVSGTVKRIEGDEFSYLVLEDQSGREQKFLWLRYFKGSDKLANNPAALNGKWVKLTYGLIECYSPKAGDYFNQKEIRSLEVLN